jgi:molybdate transport system regulatory protein
VLAVARELERVRAEVLARVLRPTTGPQDSPTAPGGDAVGPPGDPSIGLAALALRTSMRNQLPCRVDQMKPLNGQMLVSLRTAGGDTLESRITRESAQLLGLRPGLPVLALFKATAVSIGAEQPAVDGANRLIGTVTRTSRSATGGELHLGLAGGVGVVGFATETTTTPETPPLRRGVQAWAAVDASAIVIATAR